MNSVTYIIMLRNITQKPLDLYNAEQQQELFSVDRYSCFDVNY